MNNYPKVLIVSHNIFEDTNNIGKTLISLFDGWPKDKVCQVYLRSEKPSFRHCNDYFRITDREILKSYFKGSKVVGTSFNFLNSDKSSCVESEEPNDQTLYNFGNKRIPLVSFVRDLMWKRKSWKNDKFKQWLLLQKPDIILFVPNDYQLIYPIVTYASDLLNIPIVPYYMDDAFYYNVFVSPIDFIRRLSIRRNAKKIINRCSFILTIGPKMSHEYSKRFKKECLELMNSVAPNQIPVHSEKNKHELDLFYVGNLHSNRWKSILDIGKVIDQNNLNVKISVYSASSLDKRAINKISKVKSIGLCGKLLPSEVESCLLKADALLFVESFNKKSRTSTMYSLSTKIPEYLNSYKPIFAYGPSSISSIEYLKNNNLATVCSKKKDINCSLNEFLTFSQNYNFERIHDFVLENHNIRNNRKKMYQSIVDALRN